MSYFEWSPGPFLSRNRSLGMNIDKAIINLSINNLCFRNDLVNVFFFYGEMSHETHEQEGTLDFYQFLGEIFIVNILIEEKPTRGDV